MWILAFFFLHFAIYTVFRLEFLIWNWASLKVLSSSQVLQAFLIGLRFDLAALSGTFGLFALVWLWLSHQKNSKKILISLFWFTQVVIILLNSVDVELVNFTGRRFSKASLFLVGEGHLSNLIIPYMGMAFMTFFLILFYSASSWYFVRKERQVLNSRQKIISSFCIVVICIIFFRGGLQNKPITQVESRIFPDAVANHLLLNSTFTFLKSLDKSPLERLHFFDQKTMLGYLNGPVPSPAVSDNFNRSNVVIIILESFSKEYTELKNPEFTPFFNQLSREGVLFINSYANARRSIEGIGAILAGIPALMEEPFINSEFSSNQFIGLGHELEKKGYHTSFFHGAKNGSMHIDAFSKSVGIQNYFGENEYPNPQDADGTWGIFDGPFLKWACEKMTSFPKPFMSSVFTLSSHQPYTLPSGETAHPDGSIPILKAVHYTDSSLKQFMACAKQKDWFNNTLFIFVADHTGPSIKASQVFKSQFEIPILFYSPEPEKLKGLDSQQFAQQIDILPTLLEMLKIETPGSNYLARSLWQIGPKVIALYSDGRYDLVGTVQNGDQQLKAIRQYFSEGLFDNRLYYPAGSSTK